MQSLSREFTPNIYWSWSKLYNGGNDKCPTLMATICQYGDDCHRETIRQMAQSKIFKWYMSWRGYLIKQAEKLKSREMKVEWWRKMKDEWRMMKDDDFNLLRGFADRWTDRWTNRHLWL